MEQLSAPGGNRPMNVTTAPGAAVSDSTLSSTPLAGAAARSPAPAHAGRGLGVGARTAATTGRTFARRIDCCSDDADELRPAARAR